MDPINSFRALYPIDFDFLNIKEQNVLYITDGDAPVDLVLTNQSPTEIAFNKLEGNVSPTNYHLALHFRPYTLSKATLNRIQLTKETQDQGWKLMQFENQGIQTLYLLNTTELKLSPGKHIVLHFTSSAADPGRGARGTRVEMQYRSLHYTAFEKGSRSLQGTRVKYLSIVNHKGSKFIPLHVGFIGSNTVLNDGTSSNTLILSITNNTQKSLAFSQDKEKPTTFILTFETGDIDKEWALSKASDVKSIQIQYRWGLANKWQAWKDIEASEEGTNAVWKLELTHELSGLEPEYAIELRISNIVSNHPTGPAPLTLRYENVPGYWDGEFVRNVYKSPLVFREKKVGIGTQEPSSPLTIKGYDPDGKDTSWNSHIVLLDAKNNDTKGYITQKGQAMQFKNTGNGGYYFHDKNNKDSFSIDHTGNVHAVGDINTATGKIKEKGDALIPKGMIVMWSGSIDTIPKGWALCDGKDGVPDLRNRFIVGAGSDYAVTNHGGAREVTLTETEIPSHTHGVYDPGHQHGTDIQVRNSNTDIDDSSLPMYARNNAPWLYTETATTGISINYTGGGQPHENRPPYYALCFIIKT